MSRNKKTELMIARLLTAVFLFVLIYAPLSVYAAGESASENEAGNEEYETWGEAFQDTDYTENLAENIARTWASYFVSYVGTRADVVDEVADYIGDSYDRTVSLYDNLYPYLLPYSRQTVNNIDGANLSTQIYGKPIRNKNNLKLINDYTKTMENSLPSNFVQIAGSKHKTSEVTFDVFPDWLHIEDTCKCNVPNGTPNPGHHAFYTGYWGSITAKVLLNNNNDNTINYLDVSTQHSSGSSVIYKVIIPYGETANTPYLTYYQYNSNGYTNTIDSNQSISAGGWNDYTVVFSGSTYLNIRTNNGNTFNYYYYDADTKTLYSLNSAPSGAFDPNDASGSVTYEFNVINSVDFTDYTDLINQLVLDVNMSNSITNSLLIELLQELRNQRDTYVQQDNDDIYNYIDYMMQKLLEVKDVHIEIPDLTPDMGGIVDGITALLNFLASIIRTIGGLVQSLLEGLIHLFLPNQEDWDDINLQLETLTAPFGWIKEFIAEAASNISLLLFGRNVTDFDVAETEDVELVTGGSGQRSVDPDIVYNPNNGAPKIPVRFSNSSSEYFSGIEDAYIIDMSWYAPFKPVGDIIVVAFCWLCFIWRVLHDLPGIISGSSGILDNSYHDQDQEMNRYDTWHNLIGK